MNLTIDQALQQGVDAHKKGEYQDAERMYRAILQAQPNHPHAQHNLGVLAMIAGKSNDALRLFKRATAADPKVEHFWLSYVAALVREKRLDAAAQALADAKQAGVSQEKLAQFGRPVTPRPTSSSSPPRQKLADLNDKFQGNRLKQAEKLAVSLTQEFPDHQFAWKVLGAVLKQTGRLGESLAPMQQSARLSPQDAEAHSNCGGILRELGRLNEAEQSFKRALALEPDRAEAHNNLGTVLVELGRLDEAENSCRKAIALRPDFSKAHNNLGIALKRLGRLTEAEESYRLAVSVNPDFVDAHTNLGIALMELGRLDEAEASCRKAIALDADYGPAKHLLAAVTGDDTATAPLDYVENLFDEFASEFDAKLVSELDYKIPSLLAGIMLQKSGSDTLGSILDLGCGTGLFGAEISQYCERIEGLDISMNMLEQARDRDIYDKLVKQDIATYLATENLNFDYFVATDVLVYLGDLTEVFRLIQARNNSSGKFIFSTEHMDGEGYTLQLSSRYSHSKTYIEDLCKAFGYQLDLFEIHNLRLEKGRYIRGGLYFLSF